MTSQASRLRGGVIRQSQPAAQEHQRAAGLASGAKRKANAMSPQERATKDEGTPERKGLLSRLAKDIY